MKTAAAAVLFLFISITAKAQSLAWWENTVHWDGVTHWERYIIYTPGYLGPNALPVPHISNGSIDSINVFGVSGTYHYSKEDKTVNTTLYANYSFLKDKISFDLFWVPIEHYSMTHELKTERHVFAFKYYDRTATGDIHLTTNVQLFKKRFWQSALRLGYRFPTSTGIGSARSTNGPGYWMDISFGKTFRSIPHLKWIGMIGGYFWQADNIEIRHKQDDAFLIGSGLEWNKNKFRLQTYVAGYFGYFKKRDDPVVFRFNMDKTIKRNIWFFRVQQGLNDFEYSSAELGMKYIFKK
ncbi:MAG: hypothetical protein WDN26_07475 [Chitinophagaceae bacterium]